MRQGEHTDWLAEKWPGQGIDARHDFAFMLEKTLNNS